MTPSRHRIPASGPHALVLAPGDTRTDTPLNIVGDATHVLVAPEDSAGQLACFQGGAALKAAGQPEGAEDTDHVRITRAGSVRTCRPFE